MKNRFDFEFYRATVDGRRGGAVWPATVVGGGAWRRDLTVVGGGGGGVVWPATVVGRGSGGVVWPSLNISKKYFYTKVFSHFL